MSTSTPICEIVLPGYTLVDRIGSGGYAEVWRAEAPGGIQKAVKVVHGYHDDEFASQELKALERVKGVRHPFLLSLERFEIVNGRLAILTELADMSLDQRRQQCSAEGLPGIPRDELLRYMADAAEALDFLSQRHGLLHLDIKPENLLILGDHIKVADFGLVKELATRTQNSLVSGLTPTYASPEMFDDEPSAQSDQYSLAIVYQQMLVGALPFPGRTAAQLAKQHTQAEPQLIALPVEDRKIIARALAKKPIERFPSCREFVDTLARRADRVSATVPIEVPLPATSPPVPAAPAPNDTKPPSFCTTLRRAEVHSPAEPPVAASPVEIHETMVTRPVRRGDAHQEISQPDPAASPPEREETVDFAVPNVNPELSREQPTLFVAIGGIGVQVLCRYRALTAASADDVDHASESIAFDTDRIELRDACSKRWTRPLNSEDTLHIPLRLPQDYECSRDILRWVSRRWLYNIPRSLETRGYRPLGRLALVDHASRVIALIDQKLERLAAKIHSSDAVVNTRDSKLRIVILAGTGGGTGAGTAIDVANAAKALAAKRNCHADVHGFFICPNFAGNSTSPLAAANTHALLTELNHATAQGNLGSQESVERHPFESPDAPFDCVYWLPTYPKCGDAEPIDTLARAAQYLALEHVADARAVFRSCRQSRTSREESAGRWLTLRTLGVASMADQKRRLISKLAVDLADAINQYWLTDDTSENWELLIHQQEEASRAVAPPAKVEASDPSTVVAVETDFSPLALRARFRGCQKLQMTSDLLKQIQHQLGRRDERGKQVLLPRDANLIADMAASAVASLASKSQCEPTSDTVFLSDSGFRSLVEEGSRRVLARAVENADLRQRDRFLTDDSISQLMQVECQSLLEESCNRPEYRTALATMLDVDQALALTIEQSATDLLQCGADRRRLLFVPKNEVDEIRKAAARVTGDNASVHPIDADSSVVVTENAGISPRSFALRLMRILPGVADAAQRLHTRTDIDWRPILQ